MSVLSTIRLALADILELHAFRITVQSLIREKLCQTAMLFTQHSTECGIKKEAPKIRFAHNVYFVSELCCLRLKTHLFIYPRLNSSTISINIVRTYLAQLLVRF